MESVYGTDGRPRDDLTARARIRDAALTQFAENGVNGATMKGIAETAGVSTGLVQHHFGSKEALRQACDDAVIDAFRRRLTTAVDEGELGDPDFMAMLYETSPPLLRYFARVAVDGTDAAAYVFDQLTAGAEDFLTRTWPDHFEPGVPRTRDAAAAMAAMHSGTIVMHLHLARWLGVDPLDRAHSTLAMSLLDVYAAMGEYVTSEVGEQIRASVAAQQERQQHRAPKGTGDE